MKMEMKRVMNTETIKKTGTETLAETNTIPMTDVETGTCMERED